MRSMRSVRVERLDHLGPVAGMSHKGGLVDCLDGPAGPSQQQVSVGTATVAMILNGLGFSNSRLYVVPQFFAFTPPPAPAGSWDLGRTATPRLPGKDT